MRLPVALLALSAVALLGAPSLAADPPPAAPAPAPPAYPMTPAPYGAPYGMVPVPYGMAPVPYGMAPMPYGAPGAAPPSYGPWMGALVEDRRSKGMRIGGLVLFALGAAATTAGAVVLMTSELNSCVFLVEGRSSPALHRDREPVAVARQALTSCDSGPPAGAVTMAVGALLGLIGVPLFVVGNTPVLVPAARMGVGTADLRWSF